MKITDRIERLIANGLGEAHIPYIHSSDDPEVCRGSAFYLTQHGIYLDTQPYTLPGTGRVLDRVANCILIQGNQAAYVFLDLIKWMQPNPTYSISDWRPWAEAPLNTWIVGRMEVPKTEENPSGIWEATVRISGDDDDDKFGKFASIMHYNGCQLVSGFRGPFTHFRKLNERLTPLREEVPDERPSSALAFSQSHPELAAMLAKANEVVAAMTPEARDDMFRKQRESWLIGELAMGETVTMARPASPTPSEAQAKIDALCSALELVRGIICEAAPEGFNPLAGDWAERLFRSQADTLAALKLARAEQQGTKEAKPSEVQFLLDRLDDLDFSQDMDGFIRDWLGHVEPAISRLRKVVSKSEQPGPQGG